MSRRIWIVGLACTAALLAGLGWSAHYLTTRRPPGCTDPRTLALVREALQRRLGPTHAPDLVQITTVAGSELALRFVCTAAFAHPDRIRLRNGVLIESIRYSSILTGQRRTQRVRVRLEPVLRWEKVE